MYAILAYSAPGVSANGRAPNYQPVRELLVGLGGQSYFDADFAGGRKLQLFVPVIVPVIWDELRQRETL